MKDYTFEFIICEKNGGVILLDRLKLVQNIISVFDKIEVLILKENIVLIESKDLLVSYPKENNRISISTKGQFCLEIVQIINKVCKNQNLILSKPSYEVWIDTKLKSTELGEFIGHLP